MTHSTHSRKHGGHRRHCHRRHKRKVSTVIPYASGPISAESIAALNRQLNFLVIAFGGNKIVDEFGFVSLETCAFTAPHDGTLRNLFASFIITFRAALPAPQAIIITATILTAPAPSPATDGIHPPVPFDPTPLTATLLLDSTNTQLSSTGTDYQISDRTHQVSVLSGTRIALKINVTLKNGAVFDAPNGLAINGGLCYAVGH